MSIMVAVDLLGCTGSTEERAALLHKTIQLAAELKSSLGNMFGFAAVMRALELPQVSLKPLTPASASTRVALNQVQSNVMFYDLADLAAGADMGDVAAETHRGRHSVRKETKAFPEKSERWER